MNIFRLSNQISYLAMAKSDGNIENDHFALVSKWAMSML